MMMHFLSVMLQVLVQHREWMEGKDIRGRIYISAQGINAQYSGPEEDAVAYAQWVEQQPQFQVCSGSVCIVHCGACRDPGLCVDLLLQDTLSS